MYDSKGRKLQEFQLRQNQSKPLNTAIYKVVRVVSTGRIAVVQGGAKSGTPLIDARGMPVGTFFQAVIWGLTNPYILVVAYRPCKVEIYRGEAKVYEHVFTEEDVNSMRVWFQRIETVHGFFRVASTGPVSVQTSVLRMEFGSEKLIGKKFPTTLGGQAAVPANVEYRVVVPGGAVVFTPFKTTLEIDGGEITTVENQYAMLPGETVHTVKASQPVIVQVRGTEDDDAFCVLSDKDLVFYGPPKTSVKKSGGGLRVEPVVAVAAVAALSAIAFITLKKIKRPF